MKVQGGKKYEVRLVPTNCHPEEVIFEIASALDHLNSITTEIFGSLRDRIAEQRAAVSSISTRVAAAEEKIAALKANPKALQIVSSAKFPEELGEDGVPVPEETVQLKFLPALSLATLPPQRTITDSYETMARIKSGRRLYEAPIENPEELLQYYRVRDYNSKGANLSRLETSYASGLGHPPSDLNVIDSFFLFNTAENPYQNYRVVARSGTNGMSKAVRRAEEVRESAIKVPDIESEEGLNGTGVLDDFYYSPSSAQIPDIDVPDHLPNLPGLADTLDFPPIDASSGSFFSFERPSAPSSSTWTASPAAPTAHPNPPHTVPTTPVPEPVITKFVPPVAPPPPPPFQGAPPPPPFPTAAPAGTIPPPPPPPPMESPQAPTARVPPPSTKHKVGGGGEVDLRSSLMAAIREAGGSGSANLKSGQEKRNEARKKKQEEKEKAAGGGADLMSDLKSSLAMRRRGISGMNDSKQPGLGDIMQKIASSIPVNDDSVDSAHGGNFSENDDDWD